MPLIRFWHFNVAGAFVWVAVFVATGYFFGRMPWVERNLTVAMLLIVFASFAPLAVKAVGHRRLRAARDAAEL
jgi:membrane-associated protein